MKKSWHPPGSCSQRDCSQSTSHTPAALSIFLLSGPRYHRPYPLPIQCFLLRRPHHVSGHGAETVHNESPMLRSGVLFATLLMLKHIYLYLTSAYFVYLLRACCLSPKSSYKIRFGNCVKLGVGLAAGFGATLGPFLLWGQGPQLLNRLFPFSGGLSHAYPGTKRMGAVFICRPGLDS